MIMYLTANIKKPGKHKTETVINTEVGFRVKPDTATFTLMYTTSHTALYYTFHFAGQFSHISDYSAKTQNLKMLL